MGLLDDAIREHLDLKRRSGGDPAEIERLEREALGRVRREPTAPAGTAAPPVQVAPEYMDERANEPDDVPRAEIVGVPPERQPKRRGFLHRRGSSVAPDPAADLEHDQPELEQQGRDDYTHEPFDHPTLVHREDEHESETPPLSLAGRHDERPPAEGDSLKPISPMDENAVEHEPAHGFDDDEYGTFEDEPDVVDGNDDDVLEETPEFLQDTPDHDRLWFEQRPPKDFDFDE